jgi:site-specific DNA-methyltransferase (cytosine-N4-specific)
MTSQTHYSTAEVARRAEIHKDTLLRWLRKGLVSEPKRDRNGWRVFTEKELKKVIASARSENPISIVAEQAGIYETSGAIERLKAFDWDFRDSKTIYLTHGLHPYPAKFIPQIPNALIQELSSVGETVADIFCGSGTTLVEALLLKRHAIGIDANPLACLISKAKTTSLTESDVELLEALSKQAEELANSLYLHGEDSLFGTSSFISQAWRPNNRAISFWFEEFVVEELAELLSWCSDLPSDSSRNLALTAFSSIIVAVSKQDSDTRYVRRQKNVKPGDTSIRFAKSLTEAIYVAQELSNLIEPRSRCSVRCENILNRPEVERVQLVVCSPPYPNAYSYHLYHMTRMLWLGMDQPKFKHEEIGSHRKYSKKKNGATDTTFQEEMSLIFNWLVRILDVERYACFVIGNSRINGRNINNADLIAETAYRQGFREVARIQRRMLDSKKSFNPAIGKIKTEQILILQNLHER